MTEDERVSATLRRWKEHPEQFVAEEFQATPEAWQLDALQAFPNVDRLALKACKGPGKTCVLAWLIWNFLATRPNCRIGVTSITGDNLSSALWPELAKWQQRSEYLSSQFTWTKTQIFSNQYPGTWWAQARSWPRSANSEQQAHTLAGLHEDYAMGVLDESSEIPQAVMATVEAVLGSGIETKVLQAGNPTRLDGPLYRACTQERHLWHVVTITGDPDDPKRSTRVNLEWARQQIATYGADNPWVLVNVYGRFPPQSIDSLLGVDDVEQAMARQLKPSAYEWAQKRLGIDVARFGNDRTVVFPRQGLVSFKPVVMRHPRDSAVSVDIANQVMASKLRWGSELEFFDATGGWAAGAVDFMRANGLGPINVQFAAPAIDPRYANRRAEIWFAMSEWVKGGGVLPQGLTDLPAELTTPTYTFQKGKFLIEEKDQIKARLGRSCDLADALALTFGLPDMPGQIAGLPHSRTSGTRGRAVTQDDVDADS